MAVAYYPGYVDLIDRVGKYLITNPNSTVTDIARSLHVSQSAVKRRLDVLVENKAIEASISFEDLRRIEYSPRRKKN